MDKSKFSLWRASFAFCSVDSVLSEEESNWISNKMTSLPFTKEEKEILLNDLQHPPVIEDIFTQITSPVDKAFLLNQMRQLAHLDKEVTPLEKMKINKIQAAIMSKIGIVELEKDVSGVTVTETDDNIFVRFVKRD